MNIIVTVPKSELKNIEQEDQWAQKQNEETVQFWKISRKPKNLQKGDKVFFIENREIKYYHTFIDFGYDLKCEVTNRIWYGLNLILKYPETKINPIRHKGFQGFRYTTL